MTILRNISFYLIISFLICLISKLLEACFLFTYLNENIISLLITLLAINTATTGLVASKMQEMLMKFPAIDFKSTIGQMKLSLFEQIVLIGVSVLSSILLSSSVLQFPNKELILNGVLLAVLIYALDILWDTGKSVFVAIESLQELKDKQNDNSNEQQTN